MVVSVLGVLVSLDSYEGKGATSDICKLTIGPFSETVDYSKIVKQNIVIIALGIIRGALIY